MRYAKTEAATVGSLLGVKYRIQQSGQTAPKAGSADCAAEDTGLSLVLFR